MAQLAAGTMLAGYRIERFLGKGGMGVVYLASQVSLDRQIALKLIAPEHTQDVEFRERFLRESRMAASIDHPNVVPVHEAGESDGVLYVAMRYVDGSDLGALLRAEGTLAPERAARIVSQVADALDAAHARGLVHRDVKPGNVLVADPGEAEHCYLTDFGLTKQMAGDDAVTRTGTVMGTAHYIAPEQLRGDAVDGRADVYALGCVLYQLLMGRPPFVRDTEVATLWAHLNEAPPVSGSAFDDVIHRALEKDPAQRFQTAGDLGRAALHAAEAPAGDRTAPAAAVAPSSRRSRRSVLLVAAAVLAAGAVAAGAAALLGGGDPPVSKPKGGLRIAQRVPVGGIPLTVAGFGDRLWITFEDDARLAVLDTTTGKVTRSRRYGDRIATVAAGGASLWIGDFGPEAEDGKGSLVEVDPETGRELRRITTIEPYQVEADADSVWLTDAIDKVQRVDVGSGEAGRPITVERAFDVALAAGRAWVLANGDGELVPFDARSGKRAGRPIPVGARPLSAAAAGGTIWVATEPGELVRVVVGERKTAETTIGPPDPLRQVSADTKGVWVADGSGDVIAVDPRQPERQEKVRVGRDLSDLEPLGDQAWALQASAGTVSDAVRLER